MDEEKSTSLMPQRKRNSQPCSDSAKERQLNNVRASRPQPNQQTGQEASKKSTEAAKAETINNKKHLPGIEVSNRVDVPDYQKKEEGGKKKMAFNSVMNKFNGLFDKWEDTLDELNHQMDTLKYHQTKYGKMR